MEGASGACLANYGAQKIDVLDEQAAIAFQQIDGEEIRSSGNAVAAIVRHRCIVPECRIRRKALRFSALREFICS